MPAVLTHKSIMLLARERLIEIQTTIEARISAGRTVTDLERKVLAAAKSAYAMMSTFPFPETDLPGQLFARPVGDRVSKFAVMGSMGPDITGFSALLTPGQAWVFDTVHKAYPDGSREAVNAQTCDFAFELWQQVSTAIANGTFDPDPAKNQRLRDKYRRNMQAYVLGHLCHLAGDIVSHPFINDIEWHDGHSGQKKLDHADGEASHDARAARLVLLRSSTRDGQAWDGWWPTIEEVPPPFYEAYQNALEETYQSRSRQRRGFEAFEDLFKELEPQVLTTEFVRDGYSMYRSGILSIGYGWGYWSWFGMLALPALFLMLIPLLSIALEHSRREYLGADDTDAGPGERVAFEILTVPLALGSVNALVFGAILASLTTHGVKGRTAAGLTATIITVLLAVAFLATSPVDGAPGWFRWIFLFAIPAAVALVAALFGIDVFRDHRGSRGGHALVFGLPFLFFIAGLVFWVLFKAWDGVLNAGDTDVDPAVGWGINFGLWAALILVLWFVMARFMRDIRIPEHPDEFTAVRKHHVRLFDDTTLFRDPEAAAANRPDLFFPSGRRALLRLWWEGAGDLFIRSDRFQLVFSFADAENATSQFIPAPVGPMKLSEYLHFLQNSVKDPDGNAGKLKAAVVYDDPDYELPSGAVFADHGDEEESAEDHAEEAAKFRKLGTSQDNAYTLYHAPKRVQAIRFGRQGPIPAPFHTPETEIRTQEDASGYDYVHDALAATESEALMSYAGDFAALLCLGGATHLDGAIPDKVYQVFRNWSLDRRRVNEWRMLVAGKAFSEKAGHPEKYDSRMLDRFGPAKKDEWTSPLFAAGADIVAGAERTALRMGWVPMLRAWMDVERRPAEDPLANTAFRPEYPTNLELSRGMAWLLDMPDPQFVP